MATSNVSIANGALQRLGTSFRLTSLTQDHPNARALNTAFEPTRDALLRKYAWGFAIARASIAADSNGPTWGDWNRYTLPNDFIRLIRDDESGANVDWKREGDYILSRDGSPLEIRYVAKIEDPTKFDPLFVVTLELELAVRVCKQINDSTVDKESLKDDLKDAVAEAKQANAFENEAQPFPEDDWTTKNR